MSHKLVYAKSAVKDISKLDVVMKKRLLKKLESFRDNPLRCAKKLSFSRLGGYRFRVGNLRIICDINKEAIEILRAGFRGDVYKK